MFSRLITRSTRLVRSQNNNNVVAAFYSTGGKKTTPPPQQPVSVVDDDAELAELEKVDWDADLDAATIKSFHETRSASKKSYKDTIEKMLESTEKSILSSPKYEVKPQLVISTPAGKIAHALFSTASQARSLGIVTKDVELLIASFEGIPSFKSVIESDVDVNEKQTLIDLFANAVNPTPITEFFLYYMSNEKLFNLITPVLKDFKRLVESLSTEMNIRLTVAHNYNEKEKQTLESQVTSYFSSDSKIKFTYIVDPAIKGGYKIESPFLNHNASLAASVEIAEKEEKTVFTNFFNDLRNAALTNNPVWETKEFKEKYLSFDPKAYEAALDAQKN